MCRWKIVNGKSPRKDFAQMVLYFTVTAKGNSFFWNWMSLAVLLSFYLFFLHNTRTLLTCLCVQRCPHPWIHEYTQSIPNRQQFLGYKQQRSCCQNFCLLCSVTSKNCDVKSELDTTSCLFCESDVAFVWPTQNQSILFVFIQIFWLCFCWSSIRYSSQINSEHVYWCLSCQ